MNHTLQTEKKTMHDQSWFAMNSERKARLATASWVPLYQRKSTEHLDYPDVGHWEEALDSYSIVVPRRDNESDEEDEEDEVDLLQDLQWMSISVDTGHAPTIDGGGYYPSREFNDWSAGINGEYLVLLNKTIVGLDVLIEPDLICSLGLVQEGDIWVCPAEDYVPVIRMSRTDLGKVDCVEIRGPFLKDYLCARNADLVVSSFYYRTEVFDTVPSFEAPEKVDEHAYFYECREFDIDNSGSPFGTKVQTIIVGRTDVDHDDDVPVMDFAKDGDTWSKQSEFTREDGKRHRWIAELWKNEIVPPAEQSPRVRGDDVESNVEFIVDNSDTKQTAEELIAPPSRWLWFSVNLIPSILERRGSSLNWYSKETGGISFSGSSLHFGVNSDGLINVYAKDIGLLPIRWQQVFAAYNIAPEGKVSKELLASQMESQPARTVAPEDLLPQALESLNGVFKSRFDSPLLKAHESEEDLWKAIHRFVSDDSEFYKLAKNIVRVCIERFDFGLLKNLTPDAKKDLRSLKRLEHLLTENGADGRKLTSVLVGLNELRQCDSHLPGQSRLEDSYKLAEVDQSAKPYRRAEQLLANLADCISTIATVFMSDDTSDLETESSN